MPHVGRLTAHVRAGDDQQPFVLAECEVVGYERRIDYLFDDEVPSTHNLNARLHTDFRLGESQRLRTLRETCKNIEFGKGGRAPLQLAENRE